jgi:hypothetical protein
MLVSLVNKVVNKVVWRSIYLKTNILFILGTFSFHFSQSFGKPQGKNLPVLSEPMLHFLSLQRCTFFAIQTFLSMKVYQSQFFVQRAVPV